MLYLVGGRHIDYPHVIEHEGSLFIAFAGGKQTVEVLKVKLSDVDEVKMPDKPLVGTEAVSTKKSAAHGDWIDLGNEGETLYLSAELTVPARGQSAALSLATSSNQARVTIGITADGKLTAGLFEHENRGQGTQGWRKIHTAGPHRQPQRQAR